MPIPTPPVTVPAGQTVLWLAPTEVSSGFADPGTSGTVSVSTSGAYLAMFFSRSLSDYLYWAEWTGFKVPYLPRGTVIQNIYPVVIANGLIDQVSHNSQGGDGITPDNLTKPGGLNLNIPQTAGAYSGQYASGSIGNSASVIENAGVAFRLSQTLNESGYKDFAQITYAGLAVYVSIPNGLTSPVVSVSVGNTRVP